MSTTRLEPARHCRVAGVNAVDTQSREDTSTMVDNSERSIALVVEDDPWIRLLLRDLLTDEGYAVLEASNGSAALRLAQRQPPALVLLDLILPEQSGLELLTELKSTRATAHVPVIAVSARTDLLARAAELADLDALVALLTDDCFVPMPPLPFQYEGRDVVARFCASLFRSGRRFDLVRTRANCQPAFGAYLRAPNGISHGVGLYVLTLTRHRICDITPFD